jgi:hypothetical protein
VGQEKDCSLLWQAETHNGKALLESSEIIFRGDIRLKILFSEIQEVTAAGGDLRIRTPRGSAVFSLGDLAEKWRHKIANPKTVVEKLGVKLGAETAVLGKFEPKFLSDLKKTTGKSLQTKIAPATACIFLLADSSKELAAVKSTASKMTGAATLWIVYPKGQKGITENDVRSAGLKAKLVDVKVVSFSSSHTALKFVIPKSKR